MAKKAYSTITYYNQKFEIDNLMENNNEKLRPIEVHEMDSDWLFTNMKHRGRNHNSSN